MGAGDTEAAEYYGRKMLRIMLIAASAWNLFILLLSPLILKFYALSTEAKHCVLILILIHNIFSATVQPVSNLSSALRAAGDVRFTMYVNILVTILGRAVLSYLLGVVLHMGVYGIALAMCLDWCMRAIAFWIRFNQGKWKQMRVI